MKKTIQLVTVILVGSLLFSCEKFEDRPLNLTTEDYIWDENDITGQFAYQWVNDLYSRMPTAYNQRFSGAFPGNFVGVGNNTSGGLAFLECVSDDGVPSLDGDPRWNFIRGGYSPLATFDNNWGSAYTGIRVANIFLNNYEKVPFADPERRIFLPNEVRAIRAFFYFELLKRYGGIPLIGDRVFSATDPELFELKRNSFAECVDYIISELDAVKDNLRPDVTLAARRQGGQGEGNDPLGGRMRKSTVLAIKAKVLLYAASPLFNGGGIDGGNNPIFGYPTYDGERWKLAADAAKELMDMGLFELEPNRYRIFLTRVNTESIFSRMGFRNELRMPQRLTPIGYGRGYDGLPVSIASGQGMVSPTQDLVDAFPMRNGKAISDPESGYDPQDPYVNRDPRLDQTIFYNGIRWLRRDVQTFEGGFDRPNTPDLATQQTKTGYYLKKFLANDAENANYSTVPATPDLPGTFHYIRYSDILLSYAEAQNEYSGPDESVFQAVESIRQRAGLSPYQLDHSLSQEQLREVIRNERRVELAFEEHRFWDIRRWKIAGDVFTQPLKTAIIHRNEDGTFRYEYRDLVNVYFNPAMYLFPIAANEILVNPNMEQNPQY